ncbi:DUF4363 family protein [Inediibacterium massiliense]|uniref:DUF4363 family protein n=1 Tax=Inediibacterium massiliense TaxID=1658111 RepID=UPI0006B5B048|nr:DUF4363 family protein [Inediibacterium massiliense]
MKVFIASLLIMSFIVGGWFFVYDRVENTSYSFINSLDKIIESIHKNDWANASHEFEEVHKKWSRTRNTWSILLPHHEIDNIDLASAKAREYINAQNTSLSLGEIGTLKKLFHIVRENEGLTLTNIL